MSASLNVLNWVSAGDFAGVYIGSTKEHVVNVLGVPEGWAISNSADEVNDFLDADMWGYGVWVLYFNEDRLDAITGAISNIGEAGLYFDIAGYRPSAIDDAQKLMSVLENAGVKYYELAGRFRLRDGDTGEVFEKRRRISNRTFLVGEDLLGRITFDPESGQIEQMAFPYSIVAQTVGAHALKFKPSMSLVTE